MRLTLLVLAALLATAAPAAAHPVPNGLPLPLGGPPEETVASAAQVQPQPAPVPRPDCGPGSRPEPLVVPWRSAGHPTRLRPCARNLPKATRLYKWGINREAF